MNVTLLGVSRHNSSFIFALSGVQILAPSHTQPLFLVSTFFYETFPQPALQSLCSSHRSTQTGEQRNLIFDSPIHQKIQLGEWENRIEVSLVTA